MIINYLRHENNHMTIVVKYFNFRIFDTIKSWFNSGDVSLSADLNNLQLVRLNEYTSNQMKNSTSMENKCRKV